MKWRTDELSVSVCLPACLSACLPACLSAYLSLLKLKFTHMHIHVHYFRSEHTENVSNALCG